MTFETSFERLMGNEGGYTEGKGDPGGETKWGISKRSYPTLDIKNLTREEAKEIYRRDFWERAKMDALSPALAFQAFDFAVNSGIETAIRKLQTAVGVSDDGHVGPITLAAITARSETDMIALLTAQRIRFLTKRSNWPQAGAGWMNRMAKNLEYMAQDT